MGAKKFFSFLSSFDPITLSYLGRMPSKPVYDQQVNINTFIKEIKDLLPKYQQLFLFGAHGTDINGCLINVINNGINCSIGNAGLTLDGYWGINNPATGYLDTNFNPSTQGSQFAQNDAGFDIYLSNNLSPASAWACGVKATNYIGLQLNSEAFAINQAATLAIANVPFRAGLHSFNRTASNAVNAQNQNLANTTGTNVSTARPSGNIHLFNCNGLTAFYTGGICAYGIRSKLTDAEQRRMNNAINAFQQRSIYVKYGASNWGVKMAKSYFDTLHNFEPYEAWEVYEFIKRHQPDYTYTPLELSVNSGAPGLTDWVDANFDGCADGWTTTMNSTYTSVGSIVTGNGFTGNAQRSVENNAVNIAYMACTSIPMVLGKTYQISGKYRSSGTVVFGNTMGDTVIIGAANTGNAAYFSVLLSPATATGYLWMYNSIAIEGAWFEIDEVSIKEVVESDTINFNKCLNSGFGIGTDWVNPTNGLAQDWSKIANNTASIVTGNGFTGNAQRIVRESTTGDLALKPIINNLTIGKSYTIYLKYRSNNQLSVLRNDTFNNIAVIGAANTGNAIVGSVTFVAVTVGIFIGSINAAAGSYVEIDEVCIIDNSNSQFYYNFFGPNGLNKTVADYILLFKCGFSIGKSNRLSKTGASSRWNQDGQITNGAASQNIPKGSNLGIYTVSSADGFNGITNMDFSATSGLGYYGNFPLIEKIKTTGAWYLFLYLTSVKIDLRNMPQGLMNNFSINTFNAAIGYLKFNTNRLLNGVTVVNYAWLYPGANPAHSITGDMSLFTNELTPTNGIQFLFPSTARQDGLVGNLLGINTLNIGTQVIVCYAGLTAGVSNWNKNIGALNLSGCRFPTAAVDAQLAVVNAYFAGVTPIKNLTINLSGATMGIPTGGASNTDLLGIVAKHVAAGFTATITVRTS